ncbi:MAG TPA: hypothetical protein VEA61_13085 [Allosphingosinicella sp.]|nr:hypothetical protein [Allosphingosinicella sp.]
MKRLASLLPLLAGCGGPAPDAPGERIACAVDGATAFARVCTVERSPRVDGALLIVRGPNGGFRRLVASGDGAEIETADGVEAAEVTQLGNGLVEVEIGSDRYLLPARRP